MAELIVVRGGGGRVRHVFSRFSSRSRGQLCGEEVCYGPAELQRLPFRRIDSLQSNNSYFINGRVAEENDTSWPDVTKTQAIYIR